MTEKKLKEILKISDWQEVQKPEQFLTLMNYYYDLAPGVQEKIIGKIPNVLELTEEFRDYCDAGLMEYEPSIPMVMSTLVDDIRGILGDSSVVKEPGQRREASILYEVFSQWFGYYGEGCALRPL